MFASFVFYAPIMPGYKFSIMRGWFQIPVQSRQRILDDEVVGDGFVRIILLHLYEKKKLKEDRE